MCRYQLNKATIIGHLGADPEIKSFSNGGRIANLSIATSESWTDKDSGEKMENTQWHRVVIKNDALIDVVEKFLHKGSKIYIEGQLETRKFTDRENIERYSTEIVLRPYRGDLKMLDAPKPQPVKPSADKHHSKTEPKPAA